MLDKQMEHAVDYFSEDQIKVVAHLLLVSDPRVCDSSRQTHGHFLTRNVKLSSAVQKNAHRIHIL